MASEAAVPDIKQWPEDSAYLRPGLDDADELRSLIDKSISYTNEISPWFLSCIAVNDGTISDTRLPRTNLDQHEDFRDEINSASLVIIHARYSRSYLPTRSLCHLSIDEKNWWYLLRRLDIMPAFIKLLLNNNGGSFAHVTHNHDNIETGDPEIDAHSDPNHTMASGHNIGALHLGYKLGMSAEQELAVYVRTKYHGGRTIILVLGHDTALAPERTIDLLRHNEQASWVSVLTMLFARRFDAIEDTRWKVDFRTQQHEALTGFAAFGDAMNVVQTKTLEFDRDLYITTDMCRDVAYGSKRLLLNCEALISHMNYYESLICGKPRPNSPSLHQLRNERAACAAIIEQLKHQLDQVLDLSARLAVQADVKKTLINHRDMQLTLEISQATKRDSELMRGIAAVTMIFLPATFVATFFSMVFFHVDDGDASTLLVNSNIWLYPVVTIPMTVGISTWYLAHSAGKLPQFFNRKAHRLSSNDGEVI